MNFINDFTRFYKKKIFFKFYFINLFQLDNVEWTDY